ncbi:conserved protein of unknown function [Rhodovastum atsumiense]|uniref:DUF1049 domain-containing protein n=1 Tax=Rhodovastum atsumiense TaxID=504468 RepID=A0A5M6IQC7_9PROT|nr:lipopolysaccharide assembly protein LapA domain-containing protein [Rhodovastum atsumiense]KAA5610473.1 DUF1049 domain-containing protein [Rhodovastum atsumiense]CAH2600458.1 conserved protein of unknown function [Rhodovastum atsumiense]
MLRILIAFPFLLILIVFALSNPGPATLKFWPTDYTLTAPLSFAILVGMGGAFLLGAFSTWLPAVFARGRARRAERTAQQLRTQVAELKKAKAPTTAVAAR